MIGQQRLTQQVGGGTVVVLPLRLVAQVVPVLHRAVATTQPQQCHKVGLLLLAQAVDRRPRVLVRQVVGMRSSTDAAPSSAVLEPESGSVTTSWASNSRALTMMKQTPLGRNGQRWIGHHTLLGGIEGANAGPRRFRCRAGPVTFLFRLLGNRLDLGQPDVRAAVRRAPACRRAATDEPPDEILGLLGRAERLNWLVKKRRRNSFSQWRISPSS